MKRCFWIYAPSKAHQFAHQHSEVSGGGGWRWGNFLYHSRDVRAERPPFSALPGKWLALFFQQKVYDWPIFLDSYVKGPTFLTSRYMHIFFFAHRFFEAACSLGIQWIDCDIYLPPAINGCRKSKGSIWIGQHFGWSSIWMGPFFRRLGIWMG